MFVRFLALIGFSILAYLSFQTDRKIEMIIYISLALLFQPISKIVLGRELWNIVDVVVAIFLIGSIFIKEKKFNFCLHYLPQSFTL
jgi:hypothetical protein